MSLLYIAERYSSLTYRILIACVCVSLGLFLKLLWNRRRFYYASWKMKGPLSFPLIGSMWCVYGSTEEITRKTLEILEKYKPICKFWIGPTFSVILTRPEDIQIVLSQSLKKDDHYNLMKPVFGNGLFAAPVELWKVHRKTIACTFSQPILNSFVPTFVKFSNILNEKLAVNCGRKHFDIFPILHNLTLDIIGDTTMDIEMNAMNGGCEYVTWLSNLTKLTVYRLGNILYHLEFIWKLTPSARELNRSIAMSREYVMNIIERRREEVKNRKANEIEDTVKKNKFLEYLLNVTSGDKNWTDEHLIDESHTMIFAGSESTASTEAYIFMMLGMHQDIQDKVYEELYSIYQDSDRDVCVDDLLEMKYLDRVVRETLRMFPVGPLITRELQKEVELGGYMVPKGTSVGIAIFHLHRSADTWPDPLKFDPDRFLPEEVAKRHPYAYIPFSAGPRNCIGMKYAHMAIKVVVASVLRKYKVVSAPYKSISDIKIKAEILSKCVGGYQVQLDHRIP